MPAVNTPIAFGISPLTHDPILVAFSDGAEHGRLLRCMSQQMALYVGCVRNLSIAIERDADVARTTAVRRT